MPPSEMVEGVHLRRQQDALCILWPPTLYTVRMYQVQQKRESRGKICATYNSLSIPLDVDVLIA